MSLQQKLDAQKKEIETSAPKEALEVMHRATEDLEQAHTEIKSLGASLMMISPRTEEHSRTFVKNKIYLT